MQASILPPASLFSTPEKKPLVVMESSDALVYPDEMLEMLHAALPADFFHLGNFLDPLLRTPEVEIVLSALFLAW